MAFWLIKSEPGTWSWEDQVREDVTHWDGVRNYQARANLQAMRLGDLCFFYHSVKEKRIVGIVEVVREYYPDHTDSSGKFGMVDVKAFCAMPNPVDLGQIKAEPALSDLALVRQSRLSVLPVDEPSWMEICRMGGMVSVNRQNNEQQGKNNV